LVMFFSPLWYHSHLTFLSLPIAESQLRQKLQYQPILMPWGVSLLAYEITSTATLPQFGQGLVFMYSLIRLWECCRQSEALSLEGDSCLN
jgi:hypothetical protein